MAGISNANVEQIDEANEILGGRLVSVQNQFSPAFRSSLAELEHCAALGIAFLPWSPLGGIRRAGDVGADSTPRSSRSPTRAGVSAAAGRAGVGARARARRHPDPRRLPAAEHRGLRARRRPRLTADELAALVRRRATAHPDRQEQTMKTVTLGTDRVVAPNVVLGLMRIADKTDDEVRELVGTARDAGIDFFDHADVYGARAARLRAALRRGDAADAVGARRRSPSRPRPASCSDGPYFDFSYEHIIESVEGSLARAADRLHRHPAAAPARRARRARGGRPRLRRARGRRQGARVRRLEPHAAPDRPAEEVRAPADRRQPAAAVDHPRADHRPGRRGEHARPRTSRSRSTAAASSTTAASTTSPCRRGRRSRPASSRASSSTRPSTPS